MSALILHPLNTHPVLGPTSQELEGARAFLVQRPGSFDGTHWRAGDVLVSAAAEADDDGLPHVLVPRGHGRPVLGHLRPDGLFGPAGEKCNPVRWLAAGVVLATWRQHEGRWQQVEPTTVADTGLRVAVQRPRARAQGAQLALFPIQLAA